MSSHRMGIEKNVSASIKHIVLKMKQDLKRESASVKADIAADLRQAEGKILQLVDTKVIAEVNKALKGKHNQDKRAQRDRYHERPTTTIVVYPGMSARLSAADSYQQAGDWNQAITHYRRALQISPMPPAFQRYVIYNNLGWSMYHLGSWADAEEHYKRALRASPQPPPTDHAYINLATLHKAENRIKPTIKAYRAAVAAWAAAWRAACRASRQPPDDADALTMAARSAMVACGWSLVVRKPPWRPRAVILYRIAINISVGAYVTRKVADYTGRPNSSGEDFSRKKGSRKKVPGKRAPGKRVIKPIRIRSGQKTKWKKILLH